MVSLTTGAGAAMASVFGLLLGSFLNVVAYRLPRRESLARPASRCPGCETPIRPYDNVPVLSWLLLRGRCRHCRTAISWRYPVVEASTAALLGVVVLVRGTGAEDLWLALALTLLLVPVTLIDLDLRIIPNRLNLAGAVIAVALLVITLPGAIPEHLIAAAAAGGFLLVAAVAYPGGMGMGDVKLAFVLGLFLGREVAVAMFVALVAGSLAGAVVMALKGRSQGRKTAIPFGPFLALGAFAALLAGDIAIDWYADTFL